MKFIVDESTGKSSAELLKKKGYDTVYIGDKHRGISDEEITEIAEKQDRIIITNDKDFGRIAVKQKFKPAGILILRLKIETPSNKKEVIENILEQHSDKLRNNLTIAREEQIKTREL